MMRRVIVPFVAVVAVTLGFAAPAGAITYGGSVPAP
jgi:hypothetical protein